VSDTVDLHIARKLFRSAEGGRIEVARDLRLSFATGAITCLIGPSGCGKTTALRILAGLDHDFEGSVSLPAASRIGFVFQEPRLLPWRTVTDNIRLVTDRPAAFDAGPLLDELGLAEVATHFPGELSLGLARRVALARALAVDPDPLILDEPFTSLDETTAHRLRQMVLAVQARRRMTTLLVTHNIREAIEMADRIVLLAPRPARPVGDWTLDRPQGHRDEAYIEARRAEMIAAWPDLLA